MEGGKPGRVVHARATRELTFFSSGIAERLLSTYTVRTMTSPLLSQAEREALMNLLALGMYADGRLSLEEDEAINAELSSLPWESETDRLVFLGDALTQARQLDGEEAQAAHISRHAAVFATSEARIAALHSLEKLLGSDGVTPDEASFLGLARQSLGA